MFTALVLSNSEKSEILITAPVYHLSLYKRVNRYT